MTTSERKVIQDVEDIVVDFKRIFFFMFIKKLKSMFLLFRFVVKRQGISFIKVSSLDDTVFEKA